MQKNLLILSVKQIGVNLSNCDKLRDRIKETLLEEAPVNILKGNSISSEYSKELKELRNIAFSGKEVLDQMLVEKVKQQVLHLKNSFK